MLSIKAMTGGGLGEYYLSLAREDYYFEGGEPPGVWEGEGSRLVGLNGQVGREELKSILRGLCPFTGQKLAQNGGEASRHSGWDLTFSAPKSVSILWGLSDFETRKLIEAAHKESVSLVLKLLETEGIFTRRGKSGRFLERGKLVCASFLHGTSRELDPQLHSHVVVSNLCIRLDGTVGTIVGRDLFLRKMALGALYRAELTSRLSDSFEISLCAENGMPEVAEVTEKAREVFSKRRLKIERELELKGLRGAKASEKIALLSRGVKQKDVSREELYKLWAEEAEREKLKVPKIKTRLKAAARKPFPALPKIFDELTDSQSTFTQWELIRKLCQLSASFGFSATAIKERAKFLLSEHPEIIDLGKQRLEAVYTSRELLQTEDKLLSMFGENSPGFSLPTISDTTLDEEGRSALAYLLEGRPLSVLSGLAGTGKTTILKRLHAAYKERGFRVLGASLSGKASEGLEAGAGIKSSTIHKLMSDLRRKALSLDRNTLLVIDEAGMVSTRELYTLCKAALSAGSKLVLVGDEKQLQPIRAGCAFGALGAKYGRVVLQNIRRQRSSFDKERVLELASGKAEKAFHKLSEAGRLNVLSNLDAALISLVDKWEERGATRPEENLLLASERITVSLLNSFAQERRKLKGLLGNKLSSGAQNYFVGDRVLFTRTLRLVGVKNGSLGTIIGLRRFTRRLIVLLDSGKKVVIRPSKDISLGYAVTTHKAQGVTAENVYVALGGCLQDRELAYVQASRARGETHFVVTEEDAGTALRKIAFKASQSRRKLLAREVQASLGV
jgi:conjugative relaxase-like TrwC/TraI family protein